VNTLLGKQSFVYLTIFKLKTAPLGYLKRIIQSTLINPFISKGKIGEKTDLG
jgi:hypothetical protein